MAAEALLCIGIVPYSYLGCEAAIMLVDRPVVPIFWWLLPCAEALRLIGFIWKLGIGTLS